MLGQGNHGPKEADAFGDGRGLPLFSQSMMHRWPFHTPHASHPHASGQSHIVLLWFPEEASYHHTPTPHIWERGRGLYATAAATTHDNDGGISSYQQTALVGCFPTTFLLCLLRSSSVVVQQLPVPCLPHDCSSTIQSPTHRHAWTHAEVVTSKKQAQHPTSSSASAGSTFGLRPQCFLWSTSLPSCLPNSRFGRREPHFPRLQSLLASVQQARQKAQLLFV